MEYANIYRVKEYINYMFVNKLVIVSLSRKPKESKFLKASIKKSGNSNSISLIFSGPSYPSCDYFIYSFFTFYLLLPFCPNLYFFPLFIHLILSPYLSFLFICFIQSSSVYFIMAKMQHFASPSSSILSQC